MGNEKTFRTKTGFCHILPDKIIFTRDGITGNIAKVTVGNSIARILTIYGAISIGLLYFAFDNYKNGQTFSTILFGLPGLFLAYGIVSNFATDVFAKIITRKQHIPVRGR